MHDEEYAKARFGKAVGFGPLVLPYVAGESRRIIYTIIEYDPLLDSSNMSIKEWIQIAEDIKVFKSTQSVHMSMNETRQSFYVNYYLLCSRNPMNFTMVF